MNSGLGICSLFRKWLSAALHSTHRSQRNSFLRQLVDGHAEVDIQYASRSHEHLDDHRTMQNLRRAVRILSRRISAKDRRSPAFKHLFDMGCDSTISIVRLIMKALPDDGHMKDIDFSRATDAATGLPNEKFVSTCVALKNKTVLIDDVYSVPRFDLRGTRRFAEESDYTISS